MQAVKHESCKEQKLTSSGTGGGELPDRDKAKMKNIASFSNYVAICVWIYTCVEALPFEH
jgi:hypothetical protein